MKTAPKNKPSLTVEVSLPLDAFNALMDAHAVRNPEACPEEESGAAVLAAVAEQAAAVLSQWATVRQIRSLAELSPFRANLVRQVYGIGCTPKSVAELAREKAMPRRRLDETLQASLAQLGAAPF